MLGAGLLLAAQLFVTVLDPQTGLRLQGLMAEDFVAPSRVESVHQTDEPVSVLLLVDTSAAGEVVRTTAERFIAAMPEGDHLGLMTFGRSAELVKGFSDDRTAIGEALAEVKYGGDPRLIDGLGAAVNSTFPAGKIRKVIVMLTAGIEGPSRALQSSVVSAAREKCIAVYPVYLHGSGRWVFPEMARDTGGAAFWLRETTDIPGIWDTIRRPYLLKLQGPGNGIKMKGREKTFVSSLPVGTK